MSTQPQQPADNMPTRSEAEAALRANATAQTSSAAPTITTSSSDDNPSTSSTTDEPTERRGSLTSHPPLGVQFRPTFPTRASYNYAAATAPTRAERGSMSASDAPPVAKEEAEPKAKAEPVTRKAIISAEPEGE